MMVWPIEDLPVTADHDGAALADGQDGGAVPDVGGKWAACLR